MDACPDCDASFDGSPKFCPQCGTSLEMARERGRQPGSSNSSNLIGRRIFGEYQIVEQLGIGSMGTVYLAEQTSIDQKIAVKVLHPDSAHREETVKRFHREAKVISMLTHPNIVRVLVFGRTEDDLLLLAMEYVEGEELRKHVGLSPMEERTAIKIMKQACSAVAEAHDLGIIHRDLKPENILLTNFRGEENFVKILDFGIAKIKYAEDRQGTQLTEAGTVHGTPEFISPEQAQAEELDGRSDIYALGCILYEMMTGRLPFEAESGVEILKGKVFNDPPPPSEYESVDPHMEEIIMRAVARDREDRYPDALSMYDALVMREREILSESGTSLSDSYIPGSELTGMHRPPDPSDLEEASDAIAEKSDGSPGRPNSNRPPSAARRQKLGLGGDSEGPSLILIGVVGVLAIFVVGLAVVVGYLLGS